MKTSYILRNRRQAAAFIVGFGLHAKNRYCYSDDYEMVDGWVVEIADQKRPDVSDTPNIVDLRPGHS